MTDPSADFAAFLNQRLGNDQTSDSPATHTSEPSSSDLLDTIRDLVSQEKKTDQSPGALFGAFVDAQLRSKRKPL